MKKSCDDVPVGGMPLEDLIRQQDAGSETRTAGPAVPLAPTTPGDITRRHRGFSKRSIGKAIAAPFGCFMGYFIMTTLGGDIKEESLPIEARCVVYAIIFSLVYGRAGILLWRKMKENKVSDLPTQVQALATTANNRSARPRQRTYQHWHNDDGLRFELWEYAAHGSVCLIFILFSIFLAYFHGIVAFSYDTFTGGKDRKHGASLEWHRYNILTRWLGVTPSPGNTAAFVVYVVLAVLVLRHSIHVCGTLFGRLDQVAATHSKAVDTPSWLYRHSKIWRVWFDPHTGRFGLHSELYPSFLFFVEFGGIMFQFLALVQISRTPFSNGSALMVYAALITLNCVSASTLRLLRGRGDLELLSAFFFDMMYGVFFPLTLTETVFREQLFGAETFEEADGTICVTSFGDGDAVADDTQVLSGMLTARTILKVELSLASSIVLLQRFLPLFYGAMCLDDIGQMYAQRGAELHRRTSIRSRHLSVTPVSPTPSEQEEEKSTPVKRHRTRRLWTRIRTKVSSSRSTQRMADVVDAILALSRKRDAFSVRWEPTVRKVERWVAGVLLVFGLTVFIVVTLRVASGKNGCSCGDSDWMLQDRCQKMVAYPLFAGNKCACMCMSVDCGKQTWTCEHSAEKNEGGDYNGTCYVHRDDGTRGEGGDYADENDNDDDNGNGDNDDGEQGPLCTKDEIDEVYHEIIESAPFLVQLKLNGCDLRRDGRFEELVGILTEVRILRVAFARIGKYPTDPETNKMNNLLSLDACFNQIAEELEQPYAGIHPFQHFNNEIKPKFCHSEMRRHGGCGHGKYQFKHNNPLCTAYQLQYEKNNKTDTELWHQYCNPETEMSNVWLQYQRDCRRRQCCVTEHNCGDDDNSCHEVAMTYAEYLEGINPEYWP